MRTNKNIKPIGAKLMGKFTHNPVGCWEWTGPKAVGYGVVGHEHKCYKAHRVSYELFVGEIPKGKIVMHACDNRGCINPSHLFLGTNKDNTADMVNKGRHRSQKKTHCVKGHEYSKTNTYLEVYFSPKQNRIVKSRRCKTCRVSNPKGKHK